MEKVTEWSSQVQATSTKIADGAEYFETAAISDAQIGALRLDRGLGWEINRRTY